MSATVLPALPGLPPEAFEEEYNDAYVEKYLFDANGIDLSLIWEALHEAPAQRLQRLECLVNGLSTLRNACDPTECAEPASFLNQIRGLATDTDGCIVVGYSPRASALLRSDS